MAHPYIEALIAIAKKYTPLTKEELDRAKLLISSLLKLIDHRNGFEKDLYEQTIRLVPELNETEEKPVSINDKKPKKSYWDVEENALYYAVCHGHVGLVSALVEAKANVDYPPLLSSALIKDGNTKIVEILLEAKADPSASNVINTNAFHAFASLRTKEVADIARLLFKDKSRFSSLNTKNQEGNTPLMVAIVDNNQLTVRTLVEAKADVNIYSVHHYFQYPLHYALSQKKDSDIVNCLIDAKADLEKCGKSHANSLEIAISYKYFSAVYTLLSKGATINKPKELFDYLREGAEVKKSNETLYFFGSFVKDEVALQFCFDNLCHQLRKHSGTSKSKNKKILKVCQDYMAQRYPTQEGEFVLRDISLFSAKTKALSQGAQASTAGVSTEAVERDAIVATKS